MLTTNDIIEFCNTHNYDIKKTGNARWIDQKCTFDVTMAIADCILNFTENEPGKIFTTKDIWLCPYTVENIENIFKKPDVSSNAAKNEYDKFFQQPMELFAAAGILGKIKKGGRNFYHVLNRDLLEYISLREKNSLLFLQIYIEKTLKDSGVRAELDRRNEKLGYKLRSAISQKVSYVIIMGENEIQKNVVSVRKRGQANTVEFALNDFVSLLKNEIEKRR